MSVATLVVRGDGQECVDESPHVVCKGRKELRQSDVMFALNFRVNCKAGRDSNQNMSGENKVG